MSVKVRSLVTLAFLSAGAACHHTGIPRSQPSTPVTAFEVRSFKNGDMQLPYRLLKPMRVRTNQRFPLILMLHGSGAIGDDNTAQLGALAMSWADSAVRREFPAYVVVPQFSERSAYYEVDSTDGLPRSRSGSQLRAALDLVDSLLRVEAIDTSRIYVMGFSMGASAVWHVLLLRPHTFAGAIAFAGIPPERAAASLLMHENIFVLHGDADTENPPQADWAMLAALRRSGGTSALHKEFPGLGHEVPSSFVADISWRRWLFSQKLKLR